MVPNPRALISFCAVISPVQPKRLCLRRRGVTLYVTPALSQLQGTKVEEESLRDRGRAGEPQKVRERDKGETEKDREAETGKEEERERRRKEEK